MIRILELHPRPRITRAEIGKILFDVLQSGVSYELAVPERGAIRSVGDPAAIFGEADTIVWWQAVGSSAPAVPPPFWTDSEASALARRGCELPSPTETLLERARSLRRPILAARRRLLLVQPEQVFGEPQESHPVWNEIAARIAPSESEVARVTVDADTLLEPGGPLPVAGRDTRTELLPEAKPVWRVEPSGLAPREIESPTSIETLLGCPLHWILRYPAGLREPRYRVLPERQLLYGTLAHKIVGDYLARFRDDDLPEPDVAARAIVARFDETVAREAAPLVLPGMDRQRTHVRQTLARASAALVDSLRTGGFRVEATEATCSIDLPLGSPEFPLGRLEGRTDLTVRRIRDGRRALLDLKWAGERPKIEALRDGTALQLAAYSFLLREEGAWPPTAYFLFPTARLYSTHPGAFPGCFAVDGPGEREVWESVVRAVAEERVRLDRGEVRVPCAVVEEGDGRGDSAPEEPWLEAPCHRCEFRLFCGYAEESTRRGPSAGRRTR
jgi:hypothetical protein